METIIIFFMNSAAQGSFPEIEGAVAILDGLFREGIVEEDPVKMVRIFIANSRFEIFMVSEFDVYHDPYMAAEEPQKFVTLPLNKARLNQFVEFLGIPRRNDEDETKPLRPDF